MAGTKVAVIALLLLAVLTASSVPTVTAFHCVNDCIERCSNGKNLESCQAMCKTACLPAGAAEAAKEAASKVTDAVGAV